MPDTLEKETLLSVAKVVEITASSAKSFEDAIQSGIARASKTLEEIRGVRVVVIHAHLLLVATSARTIVPFCR